MALKIIKINPNLPSEASFAIKNIESSPFLINFVSSNMNLSVAEKQELLNINNLKERALKYLKIYGKGDAEVGIASRYSESKTRSEMDQQQREYYLNQQLKTIQEELGWCFL